MDQARGRQKDRAWERGQRCRHGYRDSRSNVNRGVLQLRSCKQIELVHGNGLKEHGMFSVVGVEDGLIG